MAAASGLGEAVATLTDATTIAEGAWAVVEADQAFFVSTE